MGTLKLSDYGFKDFTQLNHLNVSNTQTLSLQDHWFATENNVQILDISWNELTVLRRQTFRTLRNLVALNFSHNEIEEIEAFAFADLKELKELDLRNNRLDSLVDYWGALSTLEALYLDDNSLTKVWRGTQTFFFFISLKQSLPSLQLSSDGFKSLSYLRILSVSQNAINDLEKNCLNGLHKLQKLNLSGNSIETVPNHLFREFFNVQLQELDLNNNDISSLPSNAFENLKYLVVLDLSRNNIRDIDEYTLVGLNALRKLYLNSNNILAIGPKTFARLEQLDFLDLAGNSLETFGSDLFGTSPKKLRKLFLKGNHLTTIQPHAFDTLVNLDFLVLTDNFISEFDDRLLLPLTKLRKFHINRNRIHNLPGSLFNTTHLLQELYFDRNKLTFFPNVTNDFDHLTKIAFEANPWQCPCFREILKWVTKLGVIRKYYDGSRPVCVVTEWNDCVKNIDIAKKKQIIQTYEAAGK